MKIMMLIPNITRVKYSSTVIVHPMNSLLQTKYLTTVMENPSRNLLMKQEPVKKVFTLKYDFTLALKRIRVDKSASMIMAAVIGLSAALTELAYANLIFSRVFMESYELPAGDEVHLYIVAAAFLFMVAIIGVASYLRISEGEASYEVMKTCGASPSQILKLCLAENLVIGLAGGTSGAFGSLLIFLIICGSQFGWPLWLLSPTFEYLVSGAITAIISIGVSILFPILFSHISLNKY